MSSHTSSEFVMWQIWLLLSIIILILLYLDARKPKNFPPGPRWFPIIGCVWEFAKLHKEKGSLAKASQALAEKYGPLVGVRIGFKPGVLVNGFEAIREMYSREELNGRPNDIFSTSRTWGKRRGIIFTDSEYSLEQRRFVLKQLKDFGFRKEILSEILENRVSESIDDIKAKIKKDIVLRIDNLFETQILKTLWSLIAGRNIVMKDHEISELRDAMKDFSHNITVFGAIFSLFPFLRHICPNLCGYATYVNIHERIITFTLKKLEELKEMYNPDDPRGLIDTYFTMLNSPEKKSSFTDDQLLAICLDLFIASLETTSNVLGFAFLYLLLHPDVQKKAQDEIHRVIGNDRVPTLEDKSRLPYIECIVLESLRLSAGRSLVMPRRALRDTVFNGYFIPKDTGLVGNFRSVLIEDPGWTNPKGFVPERFLKDGKVRVPENYIPFGLGKRRCVGEIMARANMFLIIARLLQIFDFRIVPNSPPSENFIEGCSPCVSPFKAIVTLR